MTVYIVLDNSKACYDAGGLYCACFSTREGAEDFLSRYSVYDRRSFEILEEVI